MEGGMVQEGRFQAAYKTTTSELEEAIKGLNDLQAEIASYVAAEEWSERKEIRLIQLKSAEEEEKEGKKIFDKNSPVPFLSSSSLESSVVTIQSLLGDTKEKCNRIVECNKETANRLDGELEKCHQEMENLKKELAYATRCVNDLEVNMMISGSATESDSEAQNAERELEVTVCRLREENGRLHLQVKALQHEIILLKHRPIENGYLAGVLRNISEEEEEDRQQKMDETLNNFSLTQGRKNVTRNSASGQEIATTMNGYLDDSLDSSNSNSNSVGNRTFDSSSPETGGPPGLVLQDAVGKLQKELVLSREALTALKLDRKRLKSEKCELLNQMKEVYSTLEGKERELRDFIRQYEQRMKDSDKGLKELIIEKEKADEERKKFVDSLQEAEMKVGALKDSLNTKDAEINRLQLQLKELQGRFLLLTGHKPIISNSSSVQHSLSGTTSSTSMPTPSTGYDSSPMSPASANETENDPNNTTGSGKLPTSVSAYSNGHNIDAQEPTDPVIVRQQSGPSMATSSSHKRILQRRISLDNPPEGAEVVEVKMRNKSSSRNRRQSASSDRSRFSKLFGFGRSKTKELSDVESAASSSTSRRASAVGLSPSTPPDDPIAADLSLAEKAEKLLEARQMSLVRWKQAHLLAWLELELGMGRQHIKAFTENVKSGKALAKRRTECDRKNSDLLVWSNDKMRKWIEQIDLQEYGKNLQDSGIHGALAVLEPSFSVETLATALGIPANRQMVRKHLSAEFTTLQLEARSHLANQVYTPRSRKSTASGDSGGSLGRAFARSYSPRNEFLFNDQESSTPKKRSGFRGSFGKVFGIRMRRSTEEDCTSPSRRPLPGSKSMPENRRSPSVIQSSTPKDTSSRSGGDQGTMSSTTSDLGSSIERSKHMKTILGTPKVLIQPPVTGLDTSTPKFEAKPNKTDTLSQSADSAISTDTEHSPPSRITPACGVTIKMRSKSTGRVPGLGSGIRPHSIADFSPIQKLNLSANMDRSTLEPDCPFLISPERLQNWLSVDDFKDCSDSKNSEGTRPSTPPLERRIGTISEHVELEFEREMMEHKPIASSAGIWRSQDNWTSIIVEESPSPRRCRPQSLLVQYEDDSSESFDAQVIAGRGRCRNKRKVPKGEPPIAKIDLQETDL